MGVPGSGKTTWARSLFGGGLEENSWLPGVTYVSSDRIREQYFDSLTQEYNDVVFGLFHWFIYRGLRGAQVVIADSTALDKGARERLLAIARHTVCEAHLVWFQDTSLARLRNFHRSGSERVPPGVMERMVNKHSLSRYQVPAEEWATVTEVVSFGG